MMDIDCSHNLGHYEFETLEGNTEALLMTTACESDTNSQCGLVSAGAMTRLLRGDDLCTDDRFHGSTVELCGHMFVTCSVFSQNVRTSFLLLRKTINSVVECVESGEGRDRLRLLTQQCVQFLSFIECYVHRYLTCDRIHGNKKQIASNIVTQLSPLCNHLGPLEDQLGMLRTSTSDACVPHLTLRIHWTTLAVLYSLTPLLGPSKFVQFAFTIIGHCLCEGAMTFDLDQTACLHPCPCTSDLWTLIKDSLDRNTSNKSFWELLFDVLLPLLEQPTEHAQNDDALTLQISSKDPVAFSWWVLAQLAPLYVTSDPDRPHPLTTPTHWSFVLEHLVPKTFTANVSEVKVHLPLECTLKLVGVWGACPPLLYKMWDYFYRHMSDVPNTRAGLGWAPNRESSTSREWLDYILKLCIHDNDTPPTDCTSYELFLCLLHRVLCSHGNSDVELLWKQLKGRIYSKVHRRWMSDLSVWGVGRVISLYLTLAAAMDTQEVSDKMVSIVLSLSPTRDALTSLVWKGVFALVMLHVHRNLPMASLIDKLTTPICDLIGRLQSPDSRPSWEAMSVILDGTVEVIDGSNAIALGACDLIGSHFSSVLSILDGQRLNKVLEAIESIGTILSAHSSLPRTCCQGYLESCILPLPSHTLTPPHTLHSTAAAGTLLSIQWAKTIGQSLYANQLFTDFGLKESTHPFVASGYLCHVISNTVMARELVSTEHAQLAVLHTWVRCIVTSDAYSLACDDHVTELTRLIPGLPIVSSLIGVHDSPSEPLTLLKLILLSMSQRQRAAGVSGVWRERVGSVIGDLVRTVEPLLSGAGGIEGMKSCYNVCSTVIDSCPELVYSRINSRCLLPQLVDRLVLPIATTKNPSTHGQATCIKANLHHFVGGLLQLGPDKDDFVKRKIRQIFSRYFMSFCQLKGPFGSSANNPFMSLMSPWFQEQFSEDGEQQLTFILDIITSQYLQLPRQPASLLPVLVFLRECVDKMRSRCVLVRTTLSLLPSLLPCLLACDVCPPSSEPRGIRKQVMAMCRVLLGSCDPAHHSNLLSILDHFISSNISQPRGEAVFKTLGAILPLHPSLITPTLCLVERGVEGVERVRGVGNDSTLRDGYCQLQASLRKQCEH